ncbi:MAG: hypothetical protein ABEI07_01245, partial [Candidatus Nanohaloarchaea archaeon]
MPAETIFRAYDIRGEVPEELDEEVMERIGKAFGTRLRGGGEGKVVVGRDVRDSSPELEEALSRGIASTGVKVLGAGTVPSGPLLFHSRENGLHSAYVTASHLPPGNNGVKFARSDGAGYTEEENSEVEKIFQEGEFREGEGKIEDIKVLEPYRDYLLNSVEVGDIDVLLDPGNGTASLTAPDIFWEAGAELEVMNGDPEGSFPNRSSDVTEESLENLREKMEEGEHEAGFAYDGDADRLAVVDDRGRLLSSEEVAYLALEELLKEEGGPVVANVECSRLIEDVAEQYGSEVIRTRVGRSYVFREVMEQGAVLGVESSRHICIAPLFPLDDGVAVSFYLASIISGLEEP